MGDAILLIGPTGVGKTPLGNYLAETGYKGKQCCHLDFGQELRDVAAGKNPDFSREEILVVKEILEGCKLLQEDTYWIADRILEAYSADGRLLVLNGFPRHVGQAEYIEDKITIGTIVVLNADPVTIANRISRNIGGDREGRTDDDMGKIVTKLAIFHSSTEPLIGHYEGKGVHVKKIRVSTDTNPCDIYNLIKN